MSTLKPRTASVVIYQGDDLETLGELRRKADIAARHAETASSPDGATSLRVGDEVAGQVERDEAQAARDEYDAFVDEAADRSIVAHVRGIKRTLFRELMAKHPAREKNEMDSVFDVNTDEFPVPFLAEAVSRMTLGDRELSQGECREVLEDLAEGDFDRVFSTAYWLNRAPGSDPKESKFSAASRSSAGS